MPRARYASALMFVALTCLEGAPAGRSDLQTQLTQGADLLRQNKYAEALRLLEPLQADAAPDRDGGELQFLIGQAYYRLATYVEAIAHWQQALAIERTLGDRPHE